MQKISAWKMEKVNLSKRPTRGKPRCNSKKHYQKHLENWNDYVKAYEACLSATSTHHTPWYIVPADDKENARLIVSQIVLDTFKQLKMTYPKATAKRRLELKSIRKLLTDHKA